MFGRRSRARRPRLADGVALWTARAGYPLVDDGVETTVADPTDEVCFIVSDRADGGLSVARRERDQEPVWVMSAADVDVVGRFLSVEVAPAVRSADGYEPLVLSFGDEPRPGWAVAQDVDAQRVLGPDGAEVARFALEDPFGVSRSTAFTHYADASWEDFFSLLTIDVRRDDA
jgi:hypothetical protein